MAHYAVHLLDFRCHYLRRDGIYRALFYAAAKQAEWSERIVKAMNKVKRKHEATPPPPTLTEDQKLLGEIRDLLKKMNKE